MSTLKKSPFCGTIILDEKLIPEIIQIADMNLGPLLGGKILGVYSDDPSKAFFESAMYSLGGNVINYISGTTVDTLIATADIHLLEERSAEVIIKQTNLPVLLLRYSSRVKTFAEVRNIPIKEIGICKALLLIAADPTSPVLQMNHLL